MILRKTIGLPEGVSEQLRNSSWDFSITKFLLTVIYSLPIFGSFVLVFSTESLSNWFHNPRPGFFFKGIRILKVFTYLNFKLFLYKSNYGLSSFDFRPVLGSHTKLVARFWFKRRLGYALLQIYIPTIMLVVLSWFSFWIPEESVPARVALGSTTVLSIVTFTGSFRSSLPKVCY